MKTFKTLAKALMAVLMIACISSCNKDNNEDGSIFNEKKLTKIDFSDGYISYGNISFTYDDKGRLIEAEERYVNSDRFYKETIIWGDDAVKISTKQSYNGNESNNSYTLHHVDGLVQNYQINSNSYTTVYNQSNRLIKWGKDRDQTTIIWDGDKLVSATNDAYGYVNDYTFTYEKSCPKGYFPLFGVLIDVGHSLYLFFAHPELLGLRTTQLPKSITSTYEDYDPYVDTFSYELDKEGYISKIITTYSDVGSLILTWE